MKEELQFREADVKRGERLNISPARRSSGKRHSAGYNRVWTMDTNHPRLNKKSSNNNGGRVYEHILVVEKSIGRYLKKEECIHHIDGDKLNNDIENLYLCENSSHHALVHNKMEKFLNSLIKLGLVKFDKNTDDFKLTCDVSQLKISKIEE